MSSSSADHPQAAAFFDVDGTLTDTTIAHYYAFFRRRLMSPAAATLWYPAFLLKCVYYLLLDRKDRNRLNVVFYRGYAGMPAGQVKALAEECHRRVVQPRRFVEAAAHIEQHKGAGEAVILVTGSLEFTVRPLFEELGADGLLAPSLAEVDGRFTGELVGPPISQEEKARQVQAFAAEHGIDLSRSHAYGDSIADLPMLEIVGMPQVVNPDRRLAAVAAQRGWPVHRWTTNPRRRPAE